MQSHLFYFKIRIEKGCNVYISLTLGAFERDDKVSRKRMNP